VRIREERHKAYPEPEIFSIRMLRLRIREERHKEYPEPEIFSMLENITVQDNQS
jgi:hypothetical protein